VESLTPDETGALWVGTARGFDRYDPRDGRLVCVVPTAETTRSLSARAARPVLCDGTGTVWLGTFGEGVFRYDCRSGLLENFRHQTADPETIVQDSINTLYRDRSGNVWIGTFGAGISRYAPGKRKFDLLRNDPEDPDSLSGDFVWSILEDSQGYLWVGTDGSGLNRLDTRTGRNHRYEPDPRNPHACPGRPIRAITEGRDKVMWLGTIGEGLVRLDPTTGRFDAYRHDAGNPASISSDAVRAVCRGRRGELWVATHAGLNRFEPSSGTFSVYRHHPEDPSSLSHDLIYARIVEDEQGLLWLGTYGGGLNRFDPVGGTCRRFEGSGKPGCLSSPWVLSLARDRDGMIWAGTRGGLNRVDPQTGAIRTWREKDGLPNDVVYGIAEDEQGYLWLSTNRGLTRFNPGNGTFLNFDSRDGLQSDEFNGGASHAGPSGTLYFGGVYGLNFFRPERVSDPGLPAAVVLTSVLVHNRPVPIGRGSGQEESLPQAPPFLKRFSLSYKVHLLAFEFAALDYTCPSRNRYRYRLEGVDPDWVESGSRRYAGYTRLRPGSYRFLVNASRGNGLWSPEPTVVLLDIIPAFWMTLWFRGLGVLVLIGLILLMLRRRLRIVGMKSELAAAHEAQMSIMPRQDPDVEGYDVSGICLPASEVGGDFFDYFPLKSAGNGFGIVVGDVSGKAMTAAMTAVMASGMVSLKAEEEASLTAIMESVNEALCRKTDRSVFIAACLLSLQTRPLSFSCCNAGLCRPLLKRGQQVEPMERERYRFPLGVDARASFEERSQNLEAGDVLLVHTDGITESRSPGGEFYGVRRLMRLLREMDTGHASAGEIRHRIVREVLAFSGGEKPFDDMALVVVKVL